ncbi:MAG: hypothetical protein KAH20_14555 [Methylococcales bacterium]|nr:hypothetical protein [Methylococcales bacterium]
MVRLFIASCLSLLLVVNSLYAADSNISDDCSVTSLLKANQWQLIGIPCEAPPGVNTVEAIFADDINGSYGSDWVLFGYNPNSNKYEDIGLQGILQVGTGYWIISVSEQASLDLPTGSRPINPIGSTQCKRPTCFEKNMISNNTNQWQLVANPFQYSFSWSALRGKVATSNNACGGDQGCTLGGMQTAGFVENQGWYYNGTAYVSLKGTKVSPWKGIWMVALETANSANAPEILFPGTESENTETGFFHLNFSTNSLGEYNDTDIKRDWLGVLWANPNGRVNVVKENENQFLRVDYPKGGVGPDEGGAQWKVDLMSAFGITYNELYISYKLRFSNGFNPVKGGKLPGLIGGEGNTGGNPSNGYNGWSARMMWRKKTAAVFYVYHADMQGNYGDDYSWGGSEKKLFPAGEWIQVEHHIVMNTPGNKDGILQGWYNGKLVLNKHNMRYRHVDSFAIDGFYFSTFFGGSGSGWAPTRDETIDFDDFIFSTEPISH